MKKLSIALFAATVAVVSAGCGGNVDTSAGVPTTSTAGGYGAPATDPYDSATYPTTGTPPASASPTAVPVPLPSVPVPTAEPSGEPSGNPSGDPTTAPTTAPSPAPTPYGDFKIRIVDVKKSTSGYLWWKKAVATVQVQNPLLTRRQTGKLFITFFLSGAIAGQPLSSGLDLAPGEIHSFTFKATEHSDDSNAQVSTDGL